MTSQKKRILFLITGFLFLYLSAALIFYTLDKNISYFHMPSDVGTRTPKGVRLRIGGIVEPGTLVQETATQIAFSLRDEKKSIRIIYSGGLLPDLFRDSQRVIVEGVLQGEELFLADTILAKHDQNYRPLENASD